MSQDTARPDGRDANADPTVAVLIPSPVRRQILSPDAERQLASFARVVNPTRPRIADEEVPALLEGAAACLTGWGTPALSEPALARAPGLRLVAHTAGTVRRLVPLPAMERGLRVSHAAEIIADAVAEFAVLQALLCLRRLHELDRAMKVGTAWDAIREEVPGKLLGSKTVGVIGAGRVGQAVIRLFKPFGCRVLVYDPYLADDRAASLRVEKRGLADLFDQADLVTVHAPVLPETKGMIGATELARLRDGSVFLNAARAELVDEGALLRELETGRIVAALDVFAEEPLSPDSRFRDLPNVIVSPHLAGRTEDTYFRQGQAMVDEVQRFLRGEPLRYEITAAMLPVMA